MWSYGNISFFIYVSETPSSPCGNCMIPTLRPEIRSPSAFSLREYRGSHDTTGTLVSRHSFTLGPEHLRVLVRVMNREKEDIHQIVILQIN